MFTVFKDETAVVENLQNLIETIANESINKREKFFVGFSGISFRYLHLCLIIHYFYIQAALLENTYALCCQK